MPPRNHPIAIVIGASNVTRCLGPVVSAALEACGGRVDLRLVAGRGRSFGATSRVFLRTLPSIEASSLWSEVDDECANNSGGVSARHALITDIGNDIMYGHAPATILEWVDRAAQRCRTAGAELTISRLPMERLRRMSTLPYEVVRYAFFWGSPTFPLTEAIERAVAVDAGLERLATRHGATLVTPAAEWYGIDPIHIRLSKASAAWRALLTPWAGDASALERRLADGSPDGSPDRPVPRFAMLAAHVKLTCALPASACVAGIGFGDATRPARPMEFFGGRAVVRMY